VIKTCAVIGWPIEHSRSPAIINAAFAALAIDAMMEAWAVPPEALDGAVEKLRGDDMLGASITVPHKIHVAAMCDELSPAARAIGAVNCIANAGAKLIGHNTDAGGFVDALGAAGLPLAGKHVVLLGAGGAARAVAFGARDASVEVIARDPAQVAWTRARPWAELRACFTHADLLVDCTPAGLDPEADVALANAIPLDVLPASAWVATLVYHRRTILIERAEARGHSTLDGRAMLVHQGARALALWTGHAAPIGIMTRALDESLVKNT
jgi:shikimate dehydrogenase